MAKKTLKKSDEKFMLDLSSQILEHCNGKNLGDVACFVGSLSCGILHHVATLARVDVKLYLIDFSLRLRETIEETLKDYSFKP